MQVLWLFVVFWLQKSINNQSRNSIDFSMRFGMALECPKQIRTRLSIDNPDGWGHWGRVGWGVEPPFPEIGRSVDLSFCRSFVGGLVRHFRSVVPSLVGWFGTRSSRPQFPHARHGDFRIELFPLHSPLLRESLLVSFPPLNNMFKFSGSSYLSSALVLARK